MPLYSAFLGRWKWWWARWGWQCCHRRGGLRQIQDEHSPSYPPTWGIHGCYTDLPSGLRLVPLNARFIRNKTYLIHDLIADEKIDLVCITETWVRSEMDVSLQEITVDPRFQCAALAMARGAKIVGGGVCVRQYSMQFCRGPYHIMVSRGQKSLRPNHTSVQFLSTENGSLLDLLRSSIQ